MRNIFEIDGNMIKKRVKIKNKLGMHARASALFVKTSSSFESDIKIIKDDMEVSGKSIISLMMIGAETDYSYAPKIIRLVKLNETLIDVRKRNNYFEYKTK